LIGADRLRRALLAQLAKRRFSKLDFELRIDLCGRRVVVPVTGELGLRHTDVTEPHLLPAIAAGLAMYPGTFIDGGAHTGETLVKLLVLEPGRRYVGFEPQVRAAEYVRRLLAANDSPGAVIAAALGDRSGPVSLLRSTEPDEGATVLHSFRAEHGARAHVVVPMVEGDAALEAANVERVAILKLDLEGGELEAIRGLIRTIERDRPLILCEILPVGDARSEVGSFRRRRAQELLEVLGSRGYALMAIDDKGRILPADDPGALGPGCRDYALTQVDLAEPFISRTLEARAELLAAAVARGGVARLSD
jgi:FkbM family methyltransferase